MVEIYIKVSGEWHEIELFGNESINLTFNLEDLTSIQSRFANYSKEISIPGSKHNNNLFGHLYDLNSFENFTYAKQYDALVLSDSLPLFNGVMELQSIEFDEDERTIYNILLLSDFAGLKEEIKNLNLNDLDLPLSNNVNLDYVEDVLKDNVNDGIDFFPTRINERIASNSYAIEFQHLEPAHHVKTIWDKIFNNNNVSYQSNFLNSNLFNSLYLMTPNSDTKALESTVFKLEFDQIHSISKQNYSNLNKNEYDKIKKQIGNRLKVTTKNTYSGFGYDVVIGYKFDNIFLPHAINPTTPSGDNNIFGKVNVPKRIDSVISIADKFRWRNFKTKNEEPIKANVVFNEYFNVLKIEESRNYTITGNFNTEIFPDYNGTGKIKFQICKVPSATKFKNDNIRVLNEQIFEVSNPTQTSYVKNFNLEWKGTLKFQDEVFIQVINNESWDNPPFNENTIEIQSGSTWEIKASPTYYSTNVDNANQLLTSELSQKDFLNSIITMFNLQVKPIQKDVFEIEPYSDFFSNPTIKNWDEKLDYNNEMKIDFPSAEQPSTLKLSYQHESKDFHHQKYKWQTSNNINFGSRTVNNPNKENTDKKELEIAFSAQPLISFGNNYAQQILFTNGEVDFPYNPNVDSQDVIDESNTGLKSGSFKPRIFMKQTKDFPNSFFVYKFPSKNITLNNGALKFGSHLDDVINPNFDLNFFTSNNYLNNLNLPSKNLFTEYHKDAINEKFDLGNKVFTAMFYLNNLDIATLNYNDRIFVNNQYFRILQIKDFNLASNFDELTEVKLLQLSGKLNADYQDNTGDDSGDGIGDDEPRSGSSDIDFKFDEIDKSIDKLEKQTVNTQTFLVDSDTTINTIFNPDTLKLLVTDCQDGGPPTINVPCSLIKNVIEFEVNIRTDCTSSVTINLDGGCTLQNGKSNFSMENGDKIVVFQGRLYL